MIQLESSRLRRALGNIRTRIAIGAVSIAVAIGVALTVAAIVHEREVAIENLLVTGRQLAANLSRTTVLGVLAGERPQVEVEARELFEVDDVAEVAIFVGGELFVGLERAPGGPRPIAARPVPMTPPPGEVTILRSAPGRPATIAFVVPVVLEPSPGLTTVAGAPARPEVLATAEVVLSLARQIQQRREVLRRNALLLAMAVVLAVFASIMLARRIARPLERLAAAAEQVGAGQLDVAVPVESSDQLGQLSQTFNKMVEDLRALDEAKTKFLAMVSHELRTPVVPLKAYLQLALQGKLGEIPAPLQKPLEVMDRSTQRLTDHIERLLLFSVLSLGKLPVRREPCDLRQCVLDAVEHVRPRLAAQDQVLELELGEHPMQVRGDTVRLAQVFENLLSNASKFSQRGQTIRLRAERTEVRAVVEVIDHGIGIPAEQQAKIFERFYQVHAVVTRPYPGVGLGLAIVRELVARHDGTIEVHSRPGAGSTFRVELPLQAGGGR